MLQYVAKMEILVIIFVLYTFELVLNSDTTWVTYNLAKGCA